MCRRIVAFLRLDIFGMLGGTVENHFIVFCRLLCASIRSLFEPFCLIILPYMKYEVLCLYSFCFPPFLYLVMKGSTPDDASNDNMLRKLLEVDDIFLCSTQYFCSSSGGLSLLIQSVANFCIFTAIVHLDKKGEVVGQPSSDSHSFPKSSPTFVIFFILTQVNFRNWAWNKRRCYGANMKRPGT